MFCAAYNPEKAYQAFRNGLTIISHDPNDLERFFQKNKAEFSFEDVARSADGQSFRSFEESSDGPIYVTYHKHPFTEAQFKKMMALGLILESD